MNINEFTFFKLIKHRHFLSRVCEATIKTGENLILAAAGIGVFLSESPTFVLIVTGIVGVSCVIVGALLETTMKGEEQ